MVRKEEGKDVTVCTVKRDVRNLVLFTDPTKPLALTSRSPTLGKASPDSNVHGATMGPIWDRQDPGGPHVGPMNLAIWVISQINHSMAPGRSECEYNFQYCFTDIFRPSHDNVLWWMPQDLTDDKSTLVQVMAWCRQAARQYLSQCWLSSLSPYGIARPQWVN